MARFSCMLFVALILACSATPADVVEIVASKDNTLFEEDDKKSNGSGSYFFAGNTDSAETRRGVVAFDLSAVPPGSTIDDVTLTLYMSRTQSGGVPVGLHRLLADWGEGGSNAGGQEGGGDSAELNDATWRYRFYDPNDEANAPQWTTTGGDFVAGSSASISVSGNGFYSWSTAPMTIDVQGWLDAPAGNFGWLVRGQESGQKTAKRFDSRQNSNASHRPKLIVNFTPPPATGACCFPGETCQNLGISDCSNQGGTFQGDGTDCITTTCSDPIGACCSPLGNCTEESAFDCGNEGGAYQGDGETCLVTECPVVLEPFVDELPIPRAALPKTGTSSDAATYHVVMQEIQQQLHRDMPSVTVWGYGDDETTVSASYPGPTIEARSGAPVTIRYFNDLRDTAGGGALRTSHYLNVDTCPHGANDQIPRTVVHLHGGHVEQQFDGYPESTFLPGQEAAICVTDPLATCQNDLGCPGPGSCDGDGASCNFDGQCSGHGGAENCLLCEPGYHYPNNQQPSTLWFHDHALGITRLNVYMGMAAFYLIRDAVEESLGLPGPAAAVGDPPGTRYYEIPIAIQDRSFRGNPTDGFALEYHDGWVESFFGDTVLVNGKVWPYLDVDQGKYRFRLLNGSNSRRYTLTLQRVDQPGQLPFHQIGSDGGLLSAPVTLNEITLGPAERADVIVDFQQLPAGAEVVLTNSAGSPAGVIPNVMKFIVQPVTGFTGPIPATLRPVVPLETTTAVRTREFLLRKSTEPCTGQAWYIKSRNEDGVEVGQLWDDITEFPQLGTTEIWEFINPTVVPHPMHMHLVFFQVVNRQAFEIVDDQVVPVGPVILPGPEESGWKDTARTEPGQILRVIARFEDYEGKYAYHCHILEHEDHEMMRQFRTILPVDLQLGATEIAWSPIAGATGYELARGDLDTLLASKGDYANATEVCLVGGLLLTGVNDPAEPSPGQGFWYLGRNIDAIGKGTFDSGSRSQLGLRDEEIESSSNSCPN